MEPQPAGRNSISNEEVKRYDGMKEIYRKKTTIETSPVISWDHII